MQPYDYQTNANDVVIIKLSKPFDFNKKIQPACLPNESWSPDMDSNNQCFTSGWGTKKSGKKFDLKHFYLFVFLLK